MSPHALNGPTTVYMATYEEVGHGLAAELTSDKTAHRHRIVQQKRDGA